MKVENYNKRVRPVVLENKPVFVKHGVILKDISDIVSHNIIRNAT